MLKHTMKKINPDPVNLMQINSKSHPYFLVNPNKLNIMPGNLKNIDYVWNNGKEN
ncbi:hypothetical protein [Methanobacterium formicicum]|jgi:hypothetical protein|uniref:hypothetical protein n=1 Tax=Methanobacterium formicicum TaxID=2162 RepID=UPI002412B406|nr:hypothetical protein [Methanobacterium formicicum]MDG3548413.1 hypothetical protein [Methanobacterium formicicum]